MKKILYNLGYLIRGLWHHQPLLLVFTLVLVPMGVIPSFVGIYLPKMILEMVSTQVTTSVVIKTLLPLLLLLLCNYTLMGLLEEKIGSQKVIHRLMYTENLLVSAMSIDYSKIDSETGQKKYKNAIHALSSNDSGAEIFSLELRAFLTNVLGLLLYGSMVFIVSPWMMLFIVCATGLHLVLNLYKNKKIDQRYETESDISRKLNYITKTSSSFSLMKDIKIYHMKDWFRLNYGECIDGLMSLRKQNNRLKAFLDVLDGLILVVRDFIAYGFLVSAVLESKMTLAAFTFYFGAITGLSVWILGLIKNIGQFDRISKDISHFITFKALENAPEGTETYTVPEMPCDIRLENVSFRYEGASEDTLRNITLHIKKGEKIALVGVNGAGKTTLVKLLSGLYHPTEGKIFLNDIPVQSYVTKEYFKFFSVVFQEPNLLPLTLEENLTQKTSENITEEERIRLNQLLDKVGLSSKVQSLPLGLKTRLVKSVYDDAVEFSGGETQRLMMVQALYKGAPILILDEPTAALDPIAEKQIYENYKDMTSASTSVFISHRLASTRFCDRIIHLHNGEIVEVGTHDSLIAKASLYKEMFDKQSHYYKLEGEAL